MQDREQLEYNARMTVSPELYYDMVDCMDSLTDEDLYNIIACDGDYKKEMAIELK